MENGRVAGWPHVRRAQSTRYRIPQKFVQSLHKNLLFPELRVHLFRKKKALEKNR